MSKQQRDAFKGRVKRLLHAQKDMGQVSDPALQCCVAAIEAFVHDIGRRLAAEATQQQQQQHDNESSSSSAFVTPVHLKHVVQTDAALTFLHDKVAAIDELDAKYHRKPIARKRNAATSSSSSVDATKPKKRKPNAPLRPSKNANAAAAPVAVTAAAPVARVQQELTIEEDDDYDESD